MAFVDRAHFNRLESIGVVIPVLTVFLFLVTSKVRDLY